MIRITITTAAFDAVVATLPIGSVGNKNATDDRGERYVWLEPYVVEPTRPDARPGREL